MYDSKKNNTDVLLSDRTQPSDGPAPSAPAFEMLDSTTLYGAYRPVTPRAISIQHSETQPAGRLEQVKQFSRTQRDIPTWTNLGLRVGTLLSLTAVFYAKRLLDEAQHDTGYLLPMAYASMAIVAIPLFKDITHVVTFLDFMALKGEQMDRRRPVAASANNSQMLTKIHLYRWMGVITEGIAIPLFMIAGYNFGLGETQSAYNFVVAASVTNALSGLWNLLEGRTHNARTGQHTHQAKMTFAIMVWGMVCFGLGGYYSTETRKAFYLGAALGVDAIRWICSNYLESAYLESCRAEIDEKGQAKFGSEFTIKGQKYKNGEEVSLGGNRFSNPFVRCLLYCFTCCGHASSYENGIKIPEETLRSLAKTFLIKGGAFALGVALQTQGADVSIGLAAAASVMVFGTYARRNFGKAQEIAHITNQVETSTPNP